MIMKKSRLSMVAMSAAALITANTASAGELTGSFSLDVNSHFISYGLDIWRYGDSPDGTFNPSLGVEYKINDNWSFNSGFWLDVNDNVGGDFEVVETDVWIGAAYTCGIYTASLTYQSWQYGEGGLSEDVLDLGFSFDTFLNPSILFHKRLGAGGARIIENLPDPANPGVTIPTQTSGFNGTFLVLGLEHGFELNDRFSVSIPVAVGFALDEFHTDESGYGYASVGLQASYSINDYTSFNFGVNYFDTDDEVVGNDEDSFFTYNAGVSFSF